MNLLLVGITTRPRYYRLSSLSHATRLGAGLQPGAITSLERETLRRRLYGGDVPAPEVGSEQHVVPVHCQPLRMVEHGLGEEPIIEYSGRAEVQYRLHRNASCSRTSTHSGRLTPSAASMPPSTL